MTLWTDEWMDGCFLREWYNWPCSNVGSYGKIKTGVCNIESQHKEGLQSKWDLINERRFLIHFIHGRIHPMPLTLETDRCRGVVIEVCIWQDYRGMCCNVQYGESKVMGLSCVDYLQTPECLCTGLDGWTDKRDNEWIIGDESMAHSLPPSCLAPCVHTALKLCLYEDGSAWDGDFSTMHRLFRCHVLAHSN